MFLSKMTLHLSAEGGELMEVCVSLSLEVRWEWGEEERGRKRSWGGFGRGVRGGIGKLRRVRESDREYHSDILSSIP